MIILTQTERIKCCKKHTYETALITNVFYEVVG